MDMPALIVEALHHIQTCYGKCTTLQLISNANIRFEGIFKGQLLITPKAFNRSRRLPLTTGALALTVALASGGPAACPKP